MLSDKKLHDAILACETQVWKALVSGDRDADDAALHSTFLGVYPDGFAPKADHLAQLDAGPSVLSYRLSHIHVHPLGAGHAMISYRTQFRRIARSQDETMYVSSIWQRNGSGWTNIFS
ncbi:nuclear transport factor 2 family protein [uncultured Sulfitobacter sp.]|uniref:nuclear transport factor 2 family protein n=1 Tax=uncultured Sulfitobacter sp. TaxID=191468 RepID=UPI00262EA4DB|nr:nuclear transport factor 2 family protein [uncultured Sulfitobacter sp.]